MTSSRVCRFADWGTTWYRDRLVDLDEGFLLHRKQWEFVAITQALRERGCLAPGKSGLGFAVGMEPLPALFAALGCTILATDQAPGPAAERLWGAGQLCRDLAALNARGLCDPAAFGQRVRFRTVDMRALPEDLCAYDFLWSACALEHLGSLAAGLDFVVASARLLRPGGWAVHTTEFCLSSRERTYEDSNICFYRRSDLATLHERLVAVRCLLEPIDTAPGTHPLDRLVPDPAAPVCQLRQVFLEFEYTSAILVIHKHP